MDVRMPELDGLDATRRILAAEPDCRIIILTTFDLDQYVYAALASGASGFLLKHVSPEYLITAIRLVRTGDALLAPSITAAGSGSRCPARCRTAASWPASAPGSWKCSGCWPAA